MGEQSLGRWPLISLSKPPSLIPAPSKSPQAGPPSSLWAGPSVVTGGGAKPSGPHYPNPGLSQSMGPLEGVECGAVRGTGVGTASCSTARAASLDVPMPHHSLGSCVEVPCTGPGDSVTWGWGPATGYTGGEEGVYLSGAPILVCVCVCRGAGLCGTSCVHLS